MKKTVGSSHLHQHLHHVLVSAAAGNKSATWPPLTPPGCRGEWKERGRRLVGRDKGSLTEQQTEGTGTTTIQTTGIKDKVSQNARCCSVPLRQNGFDYI